MFGATLVIQVCSGQRDCTHCIDASEYHLSVPLTDRFYRPGFIQEVSLELARAQQGDNEVKVAGLPQYVKCIDIDRDHVETN
jgi:hypothetical protein